MTEGPEDDQCTDARDVVCANGSGGHQSTRKLGWGGGGVCALCSVLTKKKRGAQTRMNTHIPMHAYTY